MFIETGKELQVKGLEGELTGVVENDRERSTNPHGYGNEGSDKELTDLHTGAISKMEEGNHELRANNEISHQINQIIEKNDGVWRCKVCGKTTTLNGNIRRHAELHIEGISYICHICNKTFTNKNSRNVHTYREHKS